MNKAIVFGLAALMALMTPPMAVGHEGEDVDVTVSDFAYDPALVNIEAGTTVRWTNVGPTVHEVSVHLHNPSHDAGPHMIATGVSTNDPAAGPFEPFTMVLLEAEDDPNTPEDERVFAFTFDEPGLYVINCNLGDDHETMKMAIIVT